MPASSPRLPSERRLPRSPWKDAAAARGGAASLGRMPAPEPAPPSARAAQPDRGGPGPVAAQPRLPADVRRAAHLARRRLVPVGGVVRPGLRVHRLAGAGVGADRDDVGAVRADDVRGRPARGPVRPPAPDGGVGRRPRPAGVRLLLRHVVDRVAGVRARRGDPVAGRVLRAGRRGRRPEPGGAGGPAGRERADGVAVGNDAGRRRRPGRRGRRRVRARRRLHRRRGVVPGVRRADRAHPRPLRGVTGERGAPRAVRGHPGDLRRTRAATRGWRR